jgi:type 1 glutamine amidotransferase
VLSLRHCWPCLALALGCSEPPPTSNAKAGKEVLVPPGAGQPNVLVFHRTQGFRHESIPAGLSALTELARQGGFGLTATEDAQQFAALDAYDAVIFLSTTGDVLDASQQAAFEGFIAAGNGYVGIHAAADCEYDWPFYGNLVGAYFGGHSLVASATLNIEPVTHPAVTGLVSPWPWTDEWYGFKTNPRPQVTVLMTVDETSYDPGQGMMGPDHPVAWYHAFQGGRAFYTALGHTSESFSDPQFRAHLLGGIQWAAGILP